MSFITLIIIWTLLPVAAIVGVVVLVSRLFHRRGSTTSSITSQQNWYLYPALSKEDAVSQLFLLLGVLFFSLSLFAFNQDWGAPISWKTILFIAAALALAVAYTFKTIYSLALGLFVAAGWWTVQAVTWGFVDRQGGVKGVSIVVGVLLIALAFYLIGRCMIRTRNGSVFRSCTSFSALSRSPWYYLPARPNRD
mgnify:CR=1 FL=1